MTGSPALPRRFRDCAALISLSLVAVAPAACSRLGSSEDKPLSQYNLILINIDSLRADHLGTYGYGRDTSPFIDELAAEGIVFERAFSNSSYTRESVASLLSGRLPSVAGSTGWYATLSEEARSLSESFRASGCETGFFSNTIMLRDPGFTQGFDEVQHLPARWGISGAGLLLSKRALAFVADRGGRRFMMYLHYLDPHGPYDPAAEHYLRFAPQVSASPLRLYTDLRPRLPELLRDGVRPGEPRFEDLIRRYDFFQILNDWMPKVVVRQIFIRLLRKSSVDRVFFSDGRLSLLHRSWNEAFALDRQSSDKLRNRLHRSHRRRQRDPLKLAIQMS